MPNFALNMIKELDLLTSFAKECYRQQLHYFFFFIIEAVTVQYVVDFSPKLMEIIMESKYLEQAGYSIPELARNVALQVR